MYVKCAFKKPSLQKQQQQRIFMGKNLTCVHTMFTTRGKALQIVGLNEITLMFMLFFFFFSL